MSADATKNQNFGVATRDAGVWARQQIRAAAERPGPQHVGVIQQEHDGPATTAYASALKDEIAKYPDVTLEALEFNNGDFTKDVGIASNMLTVHPEINLLINYSGFPGVLTAIKEKRRVGKVAAIIGSDFPKTTDGYIDQGLIAGVRVFNVCGMGRTVVRRLRDAHAGRKVAPYYSDGHKIVTGEQFKKLSSDYR